MTDANDEIYVRFREHAALSERVTAVEGLSTRVEAQLSRIETAIARTAQMPLAVAPQQETAAALALHRALDAFDNRRSSGGSTPTIVLALAIIGAIALGAGAVWLMGHH